MDIRCAHRPGCFPTVLVTLLVLSGIADCDGEAIVQQYPRSRQTLQRYQYVPERYKQPGRPYTKQRDKISPKISTRTKTLSLDPVWNEVLDVGERNNSKRAAVDLYNMIKCGTQCNPLVYKGYGCYCGFLGSGGVVDGIDRCCKMHDWCYYQTTCKFLEYNLPYFVPYKWTCNGGAPYCLAGKSKDTSTGSCSHQLCECDREFVSCLADYPCPYRKAMCQSPWRYWQNLFMGLGTGMPMDTHANDIHGPPHRFKPKPLFKYPKPKFYKNRLNIEVGG